METILRKVKIIRILVVVSLISYLVWVFGRLLLWDLLSSDLRELASFDGYGALLPEFKYMYLVWVSASVVSYIGIYFLHEWGRKIFVAVYAATLILAPVSGTMINTPFERFFFIVFTLSDGMLLALLYLAWSDVFERNDSAGNRG